MIMPTNFTDVNGQYLGFEHQVGLAEDFTYRTDMSIWDTFRTLHPLLNLIAPDVQRDCLKSLVRMGRIGGTLPRWPSGAGYTGSMFGTPSDMVVAESYLKGITDFEVEEAYAFMKRTSDAGDRRADTAAN
jgi:putative alpha-1,2-mannosidase